MIDGSFAGMKKPDAGMTGCNFGQVRALTESDAEKCFPGIKPVGASHQFHDVSAGRAGCDLTKDGAVAGEEDFHVGDATFDSETAVDLLRDFFD